MGLGSLSVVIAKYEPLLISINLFISTKKRDVLLVVNSLKFTYSNTPGGRCAGFSIVRKNQP